MAARILGPLGFKEYAVAIATLGLLSSAAEMGVGKNAIRVLPGLRVSNQMSLAAGYWRYSLGTTLLASLVIGGLALCWIALRGPDAFRSPLAMAVFFLPVAALSGIGVDLVMANRASIRGMIIARLVMPGMTLAMLATAAIWAVDLSVQNLIVLYGFSSLAGTLLAAWCFLSTSPAEYFSQDPLFETATWLRQCFYLAVFALLSAALFRVSILVIEVLPIDEIEVALTAAALDTGCLILLLAKSTDKLYQPQMSIIIQQQEWEVGLKLRSKRYWLIGSACGLFLLVIFVFGRQILGLYGPQFEAGFPALCLVSVATSVWTFFSLAPAFLHYRNRSDFVLSATAISIVILLVLTALLGLRYGATGAGLAFCIVLAATAGTFRYRARRYYGPLES